MKKNAQRHTHAHTHTHKQKNQNLHIYRFCQYQIFHHYQLWLLINRLIVSLSLSRYNSPMSKFLFVCCFCFFHFISISFNHQLFILWKTSIKQKPLKAIIIIIIIIVIRLCVWIYKVIIIIIIIFMLMSFFSGYY